MSLLDYVYLYKAMTHPISQSYTLMSNATITNFDPVNYAKPFAGPIPDMMPNYRNMLAEKYLRGYVEDYGIDSILRVNIWSQLDNYFDNDILAKVDLSIDDMNFELSRKVIYNQYEPMSDFIAKVLCPAFHEELDDIFLTTKELQYEN
jgi:hypothetical protein